MVKLPSNLQYVTLVRRLFDEIYTKGNLSTIDQFFTTDVKLIDTAAPRFRGGLTGLKDLESNYLRAFPGRTIRIDDLIAIDDRVIVRWTAQGAQKGELYNFPASGRPIKVTGISIYRFNDGKICEIHQSWDRLTLFEQIGAVETTMVFRQ